MRIPRYLIVALNGILLASFTADGTSFARDKYETIRKHNIEAGPCEVETVAGGHQWNVNL
jgi:hypothetical protein